MKWARPNRRTFVPRIMQDLPVELRGLSQNRFGGHNNVRLRPLKGSTFGPASKGRSLSPDEVKPIEEKLRRDGHL